MGKISACLTWSFRAVLLLIISMLFSSNDVLELEIEAGGTRFAAAGASKAAFESLMDASQWMIYQNTVKGVLHWDFVRILSFDGIRIPGSRMPFRAPRVASSASPSLMLSV